ncbi:hypothetical protein GGTG_01608 [Gaeumannomyces tritici R3-111a-1]|uniref:Uncharacterized protein n=1 Tax=Gaeumannomyces tritici (strain R3-111a-1) TaxID=644352 RepID=J3NK26_GAET3|nr:hypothetical protein GGTG_01608 [Gaeumannomyces tritici R3-111a-1]EJT81630.1 hypothetical protein GGTG_01608 [Gaeumannomyces tritici R3-111a-1]
MSVGCTLGPLLDITLKALSFALGCKTARTLFLKKITILGMEKAKAILLKPGRKSTTSGIILIAPIPLIFLLLKGPGRPLKPL